MHLLSAWGCYSTHPPKHFLIARGGWGFLRRVLALLSRSSHKCCIGDKSGLNGGQFPENLDKLWLHVAGHYPTVKSAGVCCTKATATGRRISSLYLTAVILPSTTINFDFTLCAMPPQTITELHPSLSRSSTQASGKSSSRRRYTRRRPSGRKKRVKRDLSVKRTRLHCFIGKAWVHGLLTTPYDATDMPGSGANQSTDGGHEDHSRNRFRTIFF